MKKEEADRLVRRYKKHQESKGYHIEAHPIAGGKEDYCVICSQKVSTNLGMMHTNQRIYHNYNDSRLSLSNELKRDTGKPERWW